MPIKETRKLAVVMFADITGYTAMVQENETAALAKVDIQREVLKRMTQEYGGEVIAFYGDGSLSTYPSAIDAVKCAIKMQKAYTERNVPVRIGLHLGDMIFKEGAVLGEGVNLSAKIEAQGIPGAVLVSSKIQSEIANHPEILTKSLGHYTLGGPH
ncbi:MAG: adenylate/guanylate cyclase domain-containing protein, partial [Bacteroidetes bacterium]